MTTDGKLRRSSVTGKLLRSAMGKIKRAICCSCTDCTTVIKAVPCSQCLDENCNRLRPTHVWVCTDATCGGTPVGVETEVVFKVTGGACGDFCYKTVPGDLKLYSELTSGEQAAVFEGALDCVAGCGAAGCGTSQDTCLCVCSAYTDHDLDNNPLTPFDTFCCLGKVDSDGHVCWDWSLSEIYKRYVTRSNNDIGTGDGCCNHGRTLMEHNENRSVNPDGWQLCNDDCCRTKGSQSRQVVRIDCTGTSPPCTTWEGGSGSNPACPNVATGAWGAVVPDSTTFCTPTAVPSRTTVVFTPPYYDYYGCQAGNRSEIVEEYTCDSITVTTRTDSWEASNDVCPDPGGGNRNCCLCSAHFESENVYTVTFNRPNAGDIECAQCRAELL